MRDLGTEPETDDDQIVLIEFVEKEAVADLVHEMLAFAAGRIEPAIPRPQNGPCFPGFHEPRRTSKQTIVAVIQEAYVHRISKRAVDDMLRAMGGGMSKGQVSGFAPTSASWRASFATAGSRGRSA